MEFIKYIKILGCALFVVSCGSSPKKYELDGSDIPGYSKNEYYGFIEFSRPKGFTSYTINNIDLYYNVPGTYTTVGAKDLTSNLGVATLLPFLVRPTVQSHKQMDSLVQETGVRETRTITFKIRKFNDDRQLKKIDHYFNNDYFNVKGDLWAATTFPELFGVNCGKKHRNDTIKIIPYGVHFVEHYVTAKNVPETFRDEALKNILFIKFIDFEGCIKAGEDGQVL
ncbi:hypothetical protein ACOTY9_01625 [Enterobacter cloacae complex sp. SHL012]|uniref:hypothetical protein n=1 Tax=Enterobacter cloacae complex sp. SHL012 TaxID=3412395 RepID=UPI003BA22BAB